jgi:hypothetical protein
VSPVKYELSFYIAEDDIPRSHGRENLSSNIVMPYLYIGSPMRYKAEIHT